MWIVELLTSLIEIWIDLFQPKSSKYNNNVNYVSIEDINKLKDKVRKVKKHE